MVKILFVSTPAAHMVKILKWEQNRWREETGKGVL